MALPVINTRDDLDAIDGTPEHDEFMAVLRGSLWRLEKDDTAATWRAVEDNTTIERYGFVRADFPGTVPPELPAYVAPPSKVPKVVTLRQARLALLQFGMLAQVNTAVAAMPGAEGDEARIEWEFSNTVERERPMVRALGVALGLADAQLDDLFTLAASL